MKRSYKISIFLIYFIICSFFYTFFTVQSIDVNENDVADFFKFEQELMDLNNVVSAQSYEEENDSEFVLKRLIVNGKLVNTYGSIKKVSYGDLNVLCYESEEDTKYAYEKLSRNKDISVLVDKVVKLEEYAEKDYNYSNYDNWAAQSIDIGGYREFLLDNNVNKEVVVVVLDTGINTSHPMFENRLVKDSKGKVKGFSYYDSTYRYSYNNLSFDSSDENKYSFEDDHGHGAHVSGIITSLTPENVKILTIKIGDEKGFSTSDVIMSAYLRIINIYSKQYNIVATNLSFSGAGKSSEAEKNTFNEQCYEPLLNLNILPITAAGNESEEINIEGLKAVVVSSLKQQGNEFVFDNGYSNYGKLIDISAPGTSISSAGIADTDKADSSLTYKSGTSMASPQVAGVVALLYLNPNLPNNFTALDIERMLYNNTVDLGESKKDIYYGEGMLNLKYFELGNEEGDEFLTFYRNGVSVNKYTKYENFLDAFNLEIKCSDPSFKVIYTTNKKLPTFTNHIEYNSKINVQKSVDIYAMGVKIVNNEIVEKTDMYYISYFYSLTPLEESFTVSFRGYLDNYTGNYTHLVIPSTLHGEEIKGLEPSLFKNSNLVSISLPETVTTLGGYVFQDSKDLEYVYAPGVTKIYIAAFSGCESIKFVTDELPLIEAKEGIYLPNLVETIGFSFSGCKNLESVRLSKLETLGDSGYDFNNCPKLSYIYLPNITSIPDGTFYDCTNLKGEFHIGEFVATIGNAPFKGTGIEWFNLDKNNVNFYTDGYGLYNTNTFIAFAFVNAAIDYEVLGTVVIGGISYTITEIGSGVMTNTKVNNLTIPSTINIINGGSFSQTSIDTLYYNAENCSSEGYWDEEKFSIHHPFSNIKTIVIGASVKNVPSRLFQEIPFENLIVNSYSTKFANTSLYRFSRDGEMPALEKLVLNFDNQIDEEYFNMLFVKTSLFSRNVGLNYLYLKKDISSGWLNRVFSNLNIKKITDKYIVYSNSPLGNKLILNAYVEGFGTISNVGVTHVKFGDSITYKFVPNKGYNVDNILVDGVYLSGEELNRAIANGYTFSNIVNNHEIKVFFKKGSLYTVHLINEFEDENYSSFENIKEIQLGYGVSINYVLDEKFILSSMKVDGEEFSVKDNLECNSVGLCYVLVKNITKDTTIYLKYRLREYVISSSIVGNGQITPEGEVLVKHGKSQKFVINLDQGYYVTSIFIGDKLLSEEEIDNVVKYGYLFENVQSDNSIRVIVEKDNRVKYRIYIEIEGIGDVSPGGEVDVYEGKSQHFKFTPKEGYEVSAIFIDSKPLLELELQEAINKGYILNNVREEHKIKVVFVKKKYVIQASLEGYGAISPKGNVGVEHGGSQKFEMQVVDGYHVSNIFIGDKSLSRDEIDSVLLNGYTFINVTSNTSIKVIIEINKYIIKSIIEGNGQISPSGEIKVNFGESQKFMFSPNYGYEINSILIDGKELVKDDLQNAINHGYIFENVREDHVIKVILVKKKYVIQASLEGNGSISPKGNVIIEHGESQKFEIQVVEGYHVANIYIGSRTLSKDEVDSVVLNGYTFVNISGDNLIRVVIEINKYTIKAIVEGRGEISPNKEIELVEGGQQLFTFTPHEGYKVKAILIDGVYLSDAKLEEAIKEGYTFKNVKSNHTINVIFAKIKYVIQSSLEGYGVIIPKGNVIVEQGETQRFGIQVVEGYRVSNIYIGNKALSGEEIDYAVKNGYLFSNVNNDNSIRVVVVKKDPVEYSINASVEGKGVISPSGEINVMEGENKHFTFTPSEGYKIKSILINDVYLSDSILEVAINEGYTFKNINRNSSIKVIMESERTFKIDVEVLGKGDFDSEYDLSSINYGENVSIKFIPLEGYNIDKVWLNNGEVNIDGDSLNILDIKEDMKVVVSFEKNNFDEIDASVTISGLSCSKAEGGSVSDFIFIVLTMFGFALPRKKFFIK